MKNYTKLLLLLAVSSLALQAETFTIFSAGEKKEISFKDEPKDAGKRYENILKHANKYIPVSLRTNTPKLNMDEWGIDIGVHFLQRANGTSVSCMSEYMPIMDWGSKNVKDGNDELPLVVYIAGKGWYYHEAVIDNYTLGQGGLERHIHACVEAYNKTKKPFFRSIQLGGDNEMYDESRGISAGVSIGGSREIHK